MDGSGILVIIVATLAIIGIVVLWWLADRIWRR